MNNSKIFEQDESLVKLFEIQESTDFSLHEPHKLLHHAVAILFNASNKETSTFAAAIVASLLQSHSSVLDKKFAEEQFLGYLEKLDASAEEQNVDDSIIQCTFQLLGPDYPFAKLLDEEVSDFKLRAIASLFQRKFEAGKGTPTDVELMVQTLVNYPLSFFSEDHNRRMAVAQVMASLTVALERIDSWKPDVFMQLLSCNTTFSHFGIQEGSALNRAITTRLTEEFAGDIVSSLLQRLANYKKTTETKDEAKDILRGIRTLCESRKYFKTELNNNVISIVKQLIPLIQIQGTTFQSLDHSGNALSGELYKQPMLNSVFNLIESDSVRASACKALSSLSSMSIQADLVIPALIQMIYDKDIFTSEASMTALLQFMQETENTVTYFQELSSVFMNCLRATADIHTLDLMHCIMVQVMAVWACQDLTSLFQAYKRDHSTPYVDIALANCNRVPVDPRTMENSTVHEIVTLLESLQKRYPSHALLYRTCVLFARIPQFDEKLSLLVLDMLHQYSDDILYSPYYGGHLTLSEALAAVMKRGSLPTTNITTTIIESAIMKLYKRASDLELQSFDKMLNDILQSKMSQKLIPTLLREYVQPSVSSTIALIEERKGKSYSMLEAMKLKSPREIVFSNLELCLERLKADATPHLTSDLLHSLLSFVDDCTTLNVAATALGAIRPFSILLAEKDSNSKFSWLHSALPRILTKCIEFTNGSLDIEILCGYNTLAHFLKALPPSQAEPYLVPMLDVISQRVEDPKWQAGGIFPCDRKLIFSVMMISLARFAIVAPKAVATRVKHYFNHSLSYLSELDRLTGEVAVDVVTGTLKVIAYELDSTTGMSPLPIADACKLLLLADVDSLPFRLKQEIASMLQYFKERLPATKWNEVAEMNSNWRKYRSLLLSYSIKLADVTILFQ